MAHIEKIDNHMKILFWSLIGAMAILVVLYGYFLNSAIANVIVRSQTEKSMSLLRTEMNDMETRYSSEKGRVTLDLASARGYEKAENVQFLSAATHARGLSLRTE